MSSGIECPIEFLSLELNEDDLPSLLALRAARTDTTPAEKTKDPTPRSISEVPQFSTFANRRGKILKSTARMAAHVTTIIEPLYMVTKGLIGKALSELEGVLVSCLPSVGGRGLLMLVADPFWGFVRKRKIAGSRSKTLSKSGFLE